MCSPLATVTAIDYLEHTGEAVGEIIPLTTSHPQNAIPDRRDRVSAPSLLTADLDQTFFFEPMQFSVDNTCGKHDFAIAGLVNAIDQIPPLRTTLHSRQEKRVDESPVLHL